ncbi:MAG: glutathione S-transferase family protein [Henriciella sp.]
MGTQSQPTVATKWTPQDQDRIQLYSYPTPNGVKVSIMLEEVGLPYEPHLVALTDDEVKSEAFLSINPNGKIPAIIDPNGPDGSRLALFESGAILQYLAEKSGRLFGNSAAEKAKITQWLMFQMAGVGPMFGQVGYFYAYAGKEIEDPRPRERYLAEAVRLLNVVETQMNGQSWIAGDYSIADIALVPWLAALEYFGVHELIGWGDLSNTRSYLERFLKRPAVQRGIHIPLVD